VRTAKQRTDALAAVGNRAHHNAVKHAASIPDTRSARSCQRATEQDKTPLHKARAHRCTTHQKRGQHNAHPAQNGAHPQHIMHVPCVSRLAVQTALTAWRYKPDASARRSQRLLVLHRCAACPAGSNPPPHNTKHPPKTSCHTCKDDQHAAHAPHDPERAAADSDDKYKKSSCATAQQDKC
jgi:hypothetical protein